MPTKRCNMTTETTVKKIATRQAFGAALGELGGKYPEIVCYDADLSKSTQSQIFARKYPERFFQMGIQEANMIGAAAGISFTGKIPFICSFGAFLTGRYDQVRMSVGYAQANVKLVGTHCGVGIGEDGHSQMGLEDIALMRAIPHMVVLQPSTAQECHQMVEWAIGHPGPVYLRLTRQGLRDYPLPPWQRPGQFAQLKAGRDLALLGVGGLLEPALLAAQKLQQAGTCDPAVYNCSCAKPLDDALMEQLCSQYRTLWVLEDHNHLGGHRIGSGRMGGPAGPWGAGRALWGGGRLWGVGNSRRSVPKTRIYP